MKFNSWKRLVPWVTLMKSEFHFFIFREYIIFTWHCWNTVNLLPYKCRQLLHNGKLKICRWPNISLEYSRMCFYTLSPWHVRYASGTFSLVLFLFKLVIRKRLISRPYIETMTRKCIYAIMVLNHWIIATPLYN